MKDSASVRLPNHVTHLHEVVMRGFPALCLIVGIYARGVAVGLLFV
jgi:hypothetical protein